LDSLDLLRTLTCIIKDYFPDINPEFRSMSGGAFLYSFTYRDVGIEILPCEGYLIIRPKSLNHSGVEVEVVYSSIEELENDFPKYLKHFFFKIDSNYNKFAVLESFLKQGKEHTVQPELDYASLNIIQGLYHRYVRVGEVSDYDLTLYTEQDTLKTPLNDLDKCLKALSETN